MRLTIRESEAGDGFDFALEGPGVQQGAFEWLLSRDREEMTRLGASLAAPSRTPETLESLVEELQRLVPEDLRQALAAWPDGAPLRLLSTSRWPWELAFSRLACSRTAGQEPAAEPAPEGRSLAGVSRPESPHLAEVLPHVEVDDAEEAFGSGRFGVLHLSDWPGLPAPRETSRGSFAPSLVFVVTAQQPGRPLLEPAVSQGEDLLRRGVRAVVGTLWPGPAEPLRAGLRAFYRTLLTGTLAQAMVAFRRSCQDPLTAGSLVAFGDPELPGTELVPRLVRSELARTTLAGLERPTVILEVSAGPDEGREIPLYARSLASGRPLTVGRAGPRRCDVELDDEELENHMLRLELHGERFHLVNLTGTPTRVVLNGVPVVSGAYLAPGDRIELGRTALTFGTLTQAPASPEPRPQAEGRHVVEVLTGVGPDGGARFALADSFCLVGRLDECQVRLHDPSVSRRHASLTRRAGDWFVSPVGEARVIHNGLPLEHEQPLNHEDRLELSPKTMLRFLDLARVR